MVRVKESVAMNGVVAAALIISGLIAVLPLLFVVSASLTPYSEILRNGGYVAIPTELTLDAYKRLFADDKIPRALGVTSFITIVGTALNMVLTTLLAYPLAQRQLPGRRFFLFAILLTLLFNAGIIPTYLIVSATGLLNTIWSMIIPNAVWVFNLLVMRSFFERLPDELIESSRIDGAGELRIMVQMVLPLSIPVMLTLGLFYAAGHWNEFMQAVLYVRDADLYPLQLVIKNLIEQSQSTENVEAAVPTVTLQMAAIVVAALPMIMVYPFIQKHFQKGVTLGSVKG